MTNDTNEIGRLLSISEAAFLLNLGTSTVRQWIREGRITSHKLGARRLVPMSEVVRLTEVSRQPINIQDELSKIESNVAA
jgi:excisionase family DNA binding protein